MTIGTGDDLVAVSKNDLGYVESPAGSNCNKYSKRLGRPCQAWCADRVTCKVLDVGVDLTRTCDNTSFTPELLNDHLALGWGTDVRKAKPGAVVFFHSPGGRAGTNHTGIFISYDPRTDTVTTSDGNTSPSTKGSQHNGGCVAIKTRPRSMVTGCIQIPLSAKALAQADNVLRDLANAIAFAKAFTIDRTGTAVDIRTGQPTGVTAAQLAPVISLLQVGLNRWKDRFAFMTHQPDPADMPITGVWDDNTKDAVITLQRLLSIDDDENWGVGPLTWNAVYAPA